TVRLRLIGVQAPARAAQRIRLLQSGTPTDPISVSEAGEVAFPGVEPGPVTIYVNVDGFAPTLVRGTASMTAPLEPSVRLTPLGRITGVAVASHANPLPGARVEARSRRGFHVVETDAAGRFTFAEPFEVACDVTASWTPAEGSWHVVRTRRPLRV